MALARLSTPKQPETVGVLLAEPVHWELNKYIDLEKTRKALHRSWVSVFSFLPPPSALTVHVSHLLEVPSTESSNALVFHMAVGHGTRAHPGAFDPGSRPDPDSGSGRQPAMVTGGGP